MLTQIRKSTAFQNDIKKYDNLISTIPEGKEKTEIKQLLSNLISEVKKMDDLHLEMIYNKQMRTVGTDFRDKITNIRKQLESKIKEHKLT